jgi:hypothetical protein
MLIELRFLRKLHRDFPSDASDVVAFASQRLENVKTAVKVETELRGVKRLDAFRAIQ